MNEGLCWELAVPRGWATSCLASIPPPVKGAWVWILTFAHVGCVTLGKLVSLSEPFSHLEGGPPSVRLAVTLAASCRAVAQLGPGPCTPKAPGPMTAPCQEGPCCL